MIRLFWALRFWGRRKSGKTRENLAGQAFSFFFMFFLNSADPTILESGTGSACYNLVPRSLFPGFGGGRCHSLLGFPAFWASPFPNPLRFGHPRLILLQCFEHPPVPSRDAQIPSVLVIPPKKILGFRRKVENVLEMDSAKYKKSFPVS